MRKLIIIWSFLNFCLFSAGILLITLSILLSKPDYLILSLISTKINLKIIGITLGSTYIFSTIFSIISILFSSIENSNLLKILNIWLIIIAFLTLIFGSYIWIFSLNQISTFFEIWLNQSINIQERIQDKFQCCGYFNGTLEGGFKNQIGFCSNSIFASNQIGCQSIITSAKSPGSDFTLENIFTSIYGFEIIIGLLFLITVCLINERQIKVRFKRIDEKRGGGGFV
ncbi:uncharacterized protein I206_102047 [Kwoniella pini CBS 10737]|uniref:Tetraspanin n=1 Tax=Kwoniella pini CBS 10737 TaxID=1296096 RepID=A0A1B9HUY8_9TREE|nr:uncharacterized protein I206_06860 [Kwoniella pini CBS 10737]OCF47085.1 hypothetical protein I206_06860 [Kwoniella pini CBS 10737]